MSHAFTITLNEQPRRDGRANETLFDLAQRVGITIPHLCHKPGLTPAGNCRACVVEVKGERTLWPSCCRIRRRAWWCMHRQRARAEVAAPGAGTAAGRPAGSRHTRHNEVDHWAQRLGVGRRALRRAAGGGRCLAPGHRRQPGRLHPVHTLPARLPRRAGQRRHRPGPARRARSRIVFDMDDAMGASTCVACGECVQACPTGALAPAAARRCRSPTAA
jgi:formate dehydrogenase major subunit